MPRSATIAAAPPDDPPADRSLRQGVLLAPTEILAEQHYRTLRELLGAGRETAWAGVLTPPYLEEPLRIALLTAEIFNFLAVDDLMASNRIYDLSDAIE